MCCDGSCDVWPRSLSFLSRDEGCACPCALRAPRRPRPTCRGPADLRRESARALAARGAAGRRRQAQGRADGGSFWARALDVTAFCTRIRALHNPNNCGLKRNFLWKTRNPLRPHSTFCKWGVSAPEPSTPS